MLPVIIINKEAVHSTQYPHTHLLADHGKGSRKLNHKKYEQYCTMLCVCIRNIFTYSGYRSSGF